MPVFFPVVWVVCLRIKQRKPLVSQHVEAFLIFVSFFGFKFVSNMLGFGYTNLMFLGGNVLLVYQIFHLLGHEDLRQKRVATMVAIMHLGVGTQFVFDYKAFAILVAAVILIPRALYSVESTHFSGRTIEKTPNRGFVEIAVLSCLMIVFFLGFPRFGFQARATQQLAGAQQRGPLSSEVDMARSGAEGGEQLIFRVEGEDIGYLKCFSLDKFDGVKWSASHWLRKIGGRFNRHETDSSMFRSVRVFTFGTLGRSLPVDGFVQNLKTSYPDRPFIAGDGGVKVGFNLRNNLSYVYWTKKSIRVKQLTEKERRRYLDVPLPSTRLIEWLDGVVSDEERDEVQAKKLATYFRSEFNYKVGAPNLNRFNTLEEFIFDQREGHCERFAAALAALLRLRGIPARVAVGFLPVENNELGNFYNVRAKHAHAWTEAYFEGLGWKSIDATPYGRSVRIERKSMAFTVFEWIEYVWYSKIVEFGVYEQQAILSFLSEKFRYLTANILNILPFAVSLFSCGFILLLVYRMNWRNLTLLVKRRGCRHTRAKKTRHFYARTLKALAKRNYVKRDSQTPMEFLNFLERQNHPLVKEIRFVTECFCDSRYGQMELPSAVVTQVKDSVNKIIKSKA